MMFAYYVQYKMGLEPCVLCVYQRIPYFVILVLSILGLMFSSKRYCILLLICLTLFSSVLLAGYHSAIEKHWIEATEQCHGNFQQLSDSKSLKDSIANLHQQNIADCSEPALVILWISMAQWNLITSLVMLVFVLMIILSRQNRRKLNLTIFHI